MTKAAVLGAGLAGTLTALELTERGIPVDLIDRNPLPLRGTSYNNEGKLHLGLVYALDSTDRTVQTLVGGALGFVDIVGRWIPGDTIADAVSEPFDYLVPRQSMVSAGDLEAHFAKVDRIIRLHGAAAARRYPGYDPDRPVAVPIPADSLRAKYGDGEIVAGYRTMERAIHSPSIADRLAEVIGATPRVDFLPSRRIARVETTARGRYRVHTETPDAADILGPYDHVVNCLWESRRLIDRTIGLVDHRPCLTRYKVGASYEDQSIADGTIPNVTFVLGPFGDTVSYGRGRAYLSWYPVSLLGSTGAVDVGSWLQQQEDRIDPAIATGILDALDRLVPGSSLPRILGGRQARICGGAIVAWGDADIDDPSSELHQRFDIGVNSFGGYHSVDTGKLTLAPHFADRAADAVSARRRHYLVGA